ncbi:hypothetical protein JCM19238_2017 [Vibrio ponticus]|nr:hypothetical protein JCM19238_2017 [Vibrio ponticus]
MSDKQSILNEYLPLQLITFGDVYADEGGDEDAWLNEYDFTWQPIVDTKYHPQLYFGDELMRFKPEGQDKREAINRRTGGIPLRMPNISFCWGSKSLLIANELADELHFSERLGITRSQAEVTDAAGHLHHHFSALSFHKALTPQRIETRLSDVACEQRLLICIALKKHRSTFLIHQSLLERWQRLGIEDIHFEVEEKYRSLETLMAGKFYSARYTQRCFRNLDDFQHNQNAMLD